MQPGRPSIAHQWEVEFLAQLRISRNLSYAARKANIFRQSVYQHRSEDMDFAFAFDDVLEEARRSRSLWKTAPYSRADR